MITSVIESRPITGCFDGLLKRRHGTRVNPVPTRFRTRLGAMALVLLAAVFGWPEGECRVAAAERPAWVHSGLANASVAVAVGTNRFLTGCDEENVVKLYRSGVSGPALAEYDLTKWLDLHGHPGDADIEGAARIGDVIYWLGSHSRARDGRPRPNRERILATRIHEETNGVVTLERVGKPCVNLLSALLRAPQLSRFHLLEAMGKAPEEDGGLNLEGLAATADGGLLIGFRSPLVNGKSLVVPLRNPAEIMNGAKPELGEPLLLDLDGLGVRDMVFTGIEYFILGGRTAHGGTSHLFRWAGGTAVPEKVDKAGLRHLNPEGVANVGTRERPRLLVVSDDGNQPFNRNRPPGLRTFRSVWVDP